MKYIYILNADIFISVLKRDFSNSNTVICISVEICAFQRDIYIYLDFSIYKERYLYLQTEISLFKIVICVSNG